MLKEERKVQEDGFKKLIDGQMEQIRILQE
jgi:hypothetical protein